MQRSRKQSKPENPNTGLSVIFSEKALIALLSVTFALGIAHLQFSNLANQTLPTKVGQDRHN
ncbi:MAG: hypothetical protein KME17_21145 [Cyanosarcina radialis HA8281-LM2]|jgi:hypothetical protein|nr:hypothetical protein [Cyanosarcina radialis HA8281-LM2]